MICTGIPAAGIPAAGAAGAGGLDGGGLDGGGLDGGGLDGGGLDGGGLDGGGLDGGGVGQCIVSVTSADVTLVSPCFDAVTTRVNVPSPKFESLGSSVIVQ